MSVSNVVSPSGSKPANGERFKNRTFKDTLNGTVRFEIPFFQRGYAWEKKQWDQLFLDVQEQIISEINTGSPMDQVEHFFGPIVVLEKTGAAELKEFLVIDGQQRITTVYLLLGIIQDKRLSRTLGPRRDS